MTDFACVAPQSCVYAIVPPHLWKQTLHLMMLFSALLAYPHRFVFKCKWLGRSSFAAWHRSTPSCLRVRGCLRRACGRAACAWRRWRACSACGPRTASTSSAARASAARRRCTWPRARWTRCAARTRSAARPSCARCDASPDPNPGACGRGRAGRAALPGPAVPRALPARGVSLTQVAVTLKPKGNTVAIFQRR